MGDENLARPAIVIWSDGSTLLELSDEFGGAFIADAEVVAQHHRRDGMTVGKKPQCLVIERVLMGQWWRQHGDILGRDVNCRGR